MLKAILFGLFVVLIGRFIDFNPFPDMKGGELFGLCVLVAIFLIGLNIYEYITAYLKRNK